MSEYSFKDINPFVNDLEKSVGIVDTYEIPNSFLVDLGEIKFRFNRIMQEINEGYYRLDQFEWRGETKAVLYREHPSGVEIVAFGELEESENGQL